MSKYFVKIGGLNRKFWSVLRILYEDSFLSLCIEHKLNEDIISNLMIIYVIVCDNFGIHFIMCILFLALFNIVETSL